MLLPKENIKLNKSDKNRKKKIFQENIIYKKVSALRRGKGLVEVPFPIFLS